ncbi:MAG: ABC transporter permease [Pseudomonadota bacterium]
MKYFSLIWAALFRKPVRSVLTLASVFVAFLLFGLLQSVSVAFSSGPELSGVDRLVVAPKYSIIDDIPVNYAQRIAQVRGVEKVAHMSWFGGVYKDAANFFPRWPVPPREFLAVFPEYQLSEEEKQAFIGTRTGAIIGKALADKYGLKVGDTLPLIADIWVNKDNKPWEFEIVGIFTAPDEPAQENQMFMNYAFFDEYRAFGTGGVGNFMVTIDDPERAAEIAAAIDAMFANSSDETKTSTEKAYNQMFAKQVGDISFIMTGILSAVFFTILLLTGNTMAQAIRERIPELAILKTIGFTNLSVLMIVLAESVLVALVGGLPGLALAGFLVGGLEQATPFLAGAEMTRLVVLQGTTLAILLGLVVGLPPALRAMRLSIVDALGDAR